MIQRIVVASRKVQHCSTAVPQYPSTPVPQYPSTRPSIPPPHGGSSTEGRRDWRKAEARSAASCASMSSGSVARRQGRDRRRSPTRPRSCSPELRPSSPASTSCAVWLQILSHGAGGRGSVCVSSRVMLVPPSRLALLIVASPEPSLPSRRPTAVLLGKRHVEVVRLQRLPLLVSSRRGRRLPEFFFFFSEDLGYVFGGEERDAKE